MRSSIGRLTLRGARAVTSAPTSKFNLPRSHPRSRDLCTSTAISSDPKRKTEAEPEKKDARLSVVDILKNEPPVQVLTDGTLSASIVAEPIGASIEVTEETAKESEQVLVDPTELHEQLNSLLNRNASRSALWQYGRALNVQDAPAVDEAVMRLMLPVLGRNSWATTANDTLHLAISRGYKLPTGTLNCGLHAMSRVGKPEQIRNIMEKMWTLPVESHPNATSYNYLIAAHIYSGDVDQSFAVLNDMKKHLVYPTFATYHSLITGCLRRRDARRAYQTLLAVDRQRFDVSAMTVAQVMVACANNDDYDHVLYLLTKFEECLPRYSSELHRIAEYRGLYRMSTAERTSKGDRELLRGDPKPEIGCIATILHCAFRGGRVDLASRAWMLLEEHYPGFEPPAPLWYCLIGAYAGAGEFSQAIDYVGLMRERGLRPSMRDLEMSLVRPLAYDVNVIDEQFYRLCDRAKGKEVNDRANDTHGTAGSQTPEEANGDVAKTLPNGAEVATADQGTAPEDVSAEISTPVADGSMKDTEKHGISTEGTENVADLSTDPNTARSPSLAEALLSPDIETASGSAPSRPKPTTVGIDELNCIIAACSAAQDLERAFQTYDEVETRFKVERNIDTYNALLEGCVQTRRLAGGLRVLEEIRNVGLSISGHTLHLACRLMLRAGRTKDVEELIDKAIEKGDQVSVQTYQMTLRHFCRGENYESAAKTLKQGKEAGVSFKALTGRFDFNTAQKLREFVYDENAMHDEENCEGVDDMNQSTGAEEDVELLSDGELKKDRAEERPESRGS